jgi:glycosyltransferase involved in cell wall biosynthesis
MSTDNAMVEMDISVIVPTHNGAATLPRLLQSVRRSEIAGKLELIVCDDGSTEDIGDVLRKHGRGLPIVLLRQERQGCRAAAARNLGIAASAGNVVVFVDDDVVFGPSFLASHVETHAAAEHPRLVFGFRHRVTAAPAFIPELPSGVLNDHRIASLGFRGEALTRNPTPWYFAYTCNLSISRRCSSQLFDEAFVGWGNEDIDFAYRHWRCGAEIVCNPDAAVVHVDQPWLSDPYLNARLGRPADFTSAIVNTIRMMLKYPNDDLLLSKLRGDLVGFSIVTDRCVPDPSASLVDEVIAWGRRRICPNL